MDDSGSLDFYECAIASMAVIAVLAAFLVVAVHVSVSDADPFDGLDERSVGGRIEDGRFVPGFGDYLAGYADSRGLSGIKVVTTVPGGFCEPPEEFSVGSTEGDLWTRTFVSTVPTDDGRTVLAFFEVTLCARTSTASWRWPMQCCS